MIPRLGLLPRTQNVAGTRNQTTLGTPTISKAAELHVHCGGISIAFPLVGDEQLLQLPPYGPGKNGWS